ncbi:MAG: hypothetical protein SFX73_22855 [Kofleriaceae bacterium]|nr:hypothetical protein [Kofleriaceae bacterium]
MRDIPRRSTPTVTGIRAVVVAAAISGCVRQLPPAPPPPPVAPRVDAAMPPPTGYGRLVVDIVEGPMPVHQLRMASKPRDAGGGRVTHRFFEVPELFCAAAPCAKDVPVGNILLSFPVIGDPGAREVELVHVGPDPSVYRRSLSIYEGRTGGTRTRGILGTIFGGTALVVGTTFLPIGLARDNTGLTATGGISLGAGALLLTLGILAIRADSPTFRPGASSHFPLNAAPGN